MDGICEKACAWGDLFVMVEFVMHVAIWVFDW